MSADIMPDDKDKLESGFKTLVGSLEERQTKTDRRQKDDPTHPHGRPETCRRKGGDRRQGS